MFSFIIENYQGGFVFKKHFKIKKKQTISLFAFNK